MGWAVPAFLSDLTHEGSLPLPLRFLERQCGGFCSLTAEMLRPSRRKRKAGPPVNGLLLLSASLGHQEADGERLQSEALEVPGGGSDSRGA